ncbi:MAG TPA: hypothetical protein VH681_07600, partial [Nitrospiraceae bacterium]
FGVGVMLIILGIALALKLIQGRWHLHAHEHDGARHLHLHSHHAILDHRHPHWLKDSLQPLCIGMVHGLAGSAALLLVVLSTAKSMAAGLLYIGVFGIGSILGMVLIGAAISVPVMWSMSSGQRTLVTVQGLASCGSIALGLVIVVRVLFGDSTL